MKQRIPLAYRLPLACASGFLALALFAVSGYCFQFSTSVNLLNQAFLSMLAGVCFLAVALYIHPLVGERPAPDSRNSDPLLTPRQPNYLVAVLGVLCLAVLLEINGGFLRIAALAEATIHTQFALLVAGVILTTWGFSGGRLRFPRFRRQPNPGDTQPHLPVFSLSTQHSALSTYLLLSLILLLAFAVRMWAVGDAVHHFIDEVHFTGAVMTLRAGGYGLKLLAPFSGITAFPWLFPYMQAGGVGLLGRNLEGLRLLSVFAGTLGVGAVYFLGRVLFDQKTALLAALLLAAFPPHIQFSRIGLNNIIDPLFGTLALAFLILGLKHNRRRDFALAGAALGLTQYFYEGGRLLYPALLVVALAWYALVRPRLGAARLNLKPRLRGLLALVVVAVLIGIPIYTTLMARGEPLIARFQTVGVGGSYWVRVVEAGRPQTLEQHLVMPFLVYVRLPETALYYGGEHGMMLAYVVPFALMGVFTLLYRPRSAGFVIPLWIALTSAGNMLMTEALVYARYVVAFPALALAVAAGIHTAFALIWPKRSRLRTLAILALAAVLVVGQVTYYFGPHLTRYNQQLKQHYDTEDAMFRSAGFPWGTQIHVLATENPGAFYLSGVLSYLADGLTVFTLPPADLTPAYLVGLPRGVDQAFFVEPGDEATVALLKAHFQLQGPFPSPYNVDLHRQLHLYYARYGAPAG